MASRAYAQGRAVERTYRRWATVRPSKLRRSKALSRWTRRNPVDVFPTSRPIRERRPIDPVVFEVGDIVLCKVHGNEYFHIVKAIEGGRFQIGNNRGFTNGWIVGQRQRTLLALLATLRLCML